MDIVEVFNHWTDADFGYDREYDFWAQRRVIIRSDGVRLEPVSVQCSGARLLGSLLPASARNLAGENAKVLGHARAGRL